MKNMAKKSAAPYSFGTIRGRRISAKDAVEADTIFRQIRKRHGRLKAELVADYVQRNPRSAFARKHFTLDVRRGFRENLVNQARWLIQQVEIKVHGVGQEIRHTRIWVSAKDTASPSGRSFRPVMDVLSERDTRKTLVAEALAAYDALRRRYELLNELDAIHDAIDLALSKRKAA